MPSCSLKLWFISSSSISLYRSQFQGANSSTLLSAVRGRDAGALRDHGAFPWTSAVQGACVLFIQSKLSLFDPTLPSLLEGERGSLAASLDYSISKETSWICEMFGTTATGAPVAKRLFRRSNSGRKRPGPVSLSVNLQLLGPEEIDIFLDGQLIADAKTLSFMSSQIESTFLSDRKAAVPVIQIAAAAP